MTSAPALLEVDLENLVESPTNPRKAFDRGKLQELAQSIEQHGVRQPLLVRPCRNLPPGDYEIVAGARRYRAAKLAGLDKVPVIAREMEDTEVLELQLVENLQRQDVHPLEEAEGYRRLLKGGMDVARIAERTGRSTRYIYDRVGLLSLTKAAQDHFLAGRLTAGHAVLLARLSPEDQDRALQLGAAFEVERLLFSPGEADVDYRAGYDPDGGPKAERMKACTVKELQAWIDKHVRLPEEPDPMLFPDLELALAKADETEEKVVHITHEHQLGPDVRGQGRTLTCRSWRRADGRAGSKECEHAVTGVIVVGPGRGEAFRVCTAKDKCRVHWAAEIKEAAERKKAAAAGGGTGESRAAIERQKYQEQDRLRREARERWEKAVPAMLKALAEKVKKAPVRATGLLADRLLEQIDPSAEAAALVTRGKTAEDLVRHLAFGLFVEEAFDWDAEHTFPERAQAFGLDVRQFLAPAPEKKPAPAKKAGRKGKAA